MAMRRRLALLASVLFAGVLLSIAACGGGDDEAAAPAEDVKAGNLDFVVWSYSIETIQDNIKRVRTGKLQDVTIKLARTIRGSTTTTSWRRSSLAGNAPDVAYSSDHWLQEWVAAGLARAPSTSVAPGLAQYKGRVGAVCLGGHDARREALRRALLRRPRHLHLQRQDGEASGVQAGRRRALPELKRAGASRSSRREIAEYPINIPMKKDDPWAIEFLYSMVYGGRAAHLFDGRGPPGLQQAGERGGDGCCSGFADARNTSKISRPGLARDGRAGRRQSDGVAGAKRSPCWRSTTSPSSTSASTSRRAISAWP